MMVNRVQKSGFRAAFVAGLLSFLISAVGCGSAAGEPCKEADDCQSGLVCCKPGSGGASARGTCEETCGGDSTPDASAPDATPDDAAVDDATVEDAAAEDAAVEDAAVDDASMPAEGDASS